LISFAAIAIVEKEVHAMPANAYLAPVIPSEAETTLAKETKQILAQGLSSTLPLDLRAMNYAKQPTIRIPASAARLLMQILDEMSRGNAVKMIPVHAELTTQEAADMLNISRPSLIQLLNEGKIEFRKVGTHRRIRLENVVSYKRRLDADRKAALDELSAYDQELGL
jgi:excisionase family DNA binding protein